MGTVDPCTVNSPAPRNHHVNRPSPSPSKQKKRHPTLPHPASPLISDLDHLTILRHPRDRTESIIPIRRPAMSSKEASSTAKDKDKSKVHKLSLKGSSRLVAEFVRLSRPPPPATASLTLRPPVPILYPHDPVRELSTPIEPTACPRPAPSPLTIDLHTGSSVEYTQPRISQRAHPLRPHRTPSTSGC